MQKIFFYLFSLMIFLIILINVFAGPCNCFYMYPAQLTRANQITACSNLGPNWNLMTVTTENKAYLKSFVNSKGYNSYFAMVANRAVPADYSYNRRCSDDPTWPESWKTLLIKNIAGDDFCFSDIKDTDLSSGVCHNPNAASCNEQGFAEYSVEVCDGLDNDCDGLIDEEGVCGCYNANDPIKSAVYSANKILPISDTNLIAYYPFNGNLNNVKGNWNLDPNWGAVTFSSSSVKNDFNYSVYFNGASSLVLSNTATFLNNQNYSICLWYKQEANQPMQELISGREGQYSWTGLEIQTDGYLNNISAGGLFTSPIPSINVWQHICYTKQGTNSKLYLNGVTVSSRADSTIINPFPYWLLLGRDSYPYDISSYEYFKGYMDDLIIFNRTLSDVEIKKLALGPSANLPLCQEKICDGLDDDGDGLIDEDSVCGCYNPISPTKGAVYPANKINISLNKEDWSAYLPFDGNAKDVSTNSNNGTVTNATLSTDRFGDVNKAYSFDSATKYITIPDSTSLDISGNITISFWLKVNSTYPNWVPLIYKGNAYGQRAYTIWTYSDNRILFSLHNYNATVAINLQTGANAIQNGVWNHVVATRNSQDGNASIYVNGKLVATTIGFLGNGIVTDQPLYVNRSSESAFSNYYLNGSIDEVGVLPVALKATEVSQLYKLSKESNFNFDKLDDVLISPISYWPFDINAKDYVGPNNGTIQLNGLTLQDGLFSKAYRFSGPTNPGYISVANNASLNFGTNQFSYCLWYNEEEGLVSGQLIARRNTAPWTWDRKSNYEAQINRGENKMRVSIDSYTGTPSYLHVISPPPEINKWHHLCFVKDKGVFIDGNLVSAYDSSSFDLANFDSPLYFGSDRVMEAAYPITGAEYFKGMIDDVSIWGKNLTECEVKQLALGPSACLPVCTETICDGLDDDGDGLIDEGLTSIFYLDLDNDGFGDKDNFVEACVAPEGYVDNNLDCDDSNSLVNPNVVEVCNNLDDDCDGLINEGLDCDILCPDCDFVEELIKITPISTNVIDGNIVLNINFSCNSNLLEDQGKININSIFVDTKNGSTSVLFEPIINCDSTVVSRQIIIDGCEQTNYLVSFGFDLNDSFCTNIKNCEGLESVLLPLSCENNSFYWNGGEIVPINSTPNAFAIPDNSVFSLIFVLMIIVFISFKGKKK